MHFIYMNDKIIVRDIVDDEVTIYNPDGTILVITRNMLCVNDILIQIKEQELEGYTLERNGNVCQIRKSGRIREFGSDVYSAQLRKLI